MGLFFEQLEGTFFGTSYSMMKEPGFSTARAKPSRLGPLTMVASVMEARSLTSPALTENVAAAPPSLSVSYLPLNVAFIVNNVEDSGGREREREKRERTEKEMCPKRLRLLSEGWFKKESVSLLSMLSREAKAFITMNDTVSLFKPDVV